MGSGDREGDEERGRRAWEREERGARRAGEERGERGKEKDKSRKKQQTLEDEQNVIDFLCPSFTKIKMRKSVSSLLIDSIPLEKMPGRKY